MPRPTAAQLAYGSCTVIFSTLAMLLLSQTSSGVGRRGHRRRRARSRAAGRHDGAHAQDSPAVVAVRRARPRRAARAGGGTGTGRAAS